jgi:hypothetical protein
MTTVERRIIAYMEETSPDSSGAIHSSDGARSYGYRAALVGGITVYGWSVPAIIEALGEDWHHNGWSGFQFRRPVYAGEEVTASVTQRSEQHFELLVSKGDGERCVVGTVGHGTAPWLSEFEDPEDRKLGGPLAEPIPLTLDDAPIGHDLQPVVLEPTAEEARAYADRLQDSNPLWSGSQPVLHPAWYGNLQPAMRATFSFGPSMHASSEIQYLLPLRPDQPITLASRLATVYERRGHHYATIHGVYLDEDGREHVKVRYTTVFKIAERE